MHACIPIAIWGLHGRARCMSSCTLLCGVAAGLSCGCDSGPSLQLLHGMAWQPHASHLILAGLHIVLPLFLSCLPALGPVLRGRESQDDCACRELLHVCRLKACKGSDRMPYPARPWVHGAWCGVHGGWCTWRSMACAWTCTACTHRPTLCVCLHAPASMNAQIGHPGSSSSSSFFTSSFFAFCSDMICLFKGKMTSKDVACRVHEHGTSDDGGDGRVMQV
jgi:hypothetical protein